MNLKISLFYEKGWLYMCSNKYDECENCEFLDKDCEIMVYDSKHYPRMEYVYPAVKCNKKGVYALSIWKLIEDEIFEDNYIDMSEDERILYVNNNEICVQF